MLGDQLLRGGLVVHGQRHDRDIYLGEAVQRPLERDELGVAVRAPGPSVEQDDAEMSGQVIRQTERTAARKADGERRERIAGMQQCLVSHARSARMDRALLPASGRYPGIAAHLRACGSCGEDFETLLAAVRDAADRPESPALQRPRGLTAVIFACTT